MLLSCAYQVTKLCVQVSKVCIKLQTYAHNLRTKVLRAIYLRAHTSYQLVQRNQLRNHKCMCSSYYRTCMIMIAQLAPVTCVHK